MAPSGNSSQEQPNTYFVQHHSTKVYKEELTRLQLQGEMLTTAMGGVLAEQSNPERFQKVLDIACGTGEWLIEAAKVLPPHTQLVGIDINQKLLEYAQNMAEVQQVQDRVHFHPMDVIKKLDFAADSFDLVNLRLAQSFVRTWEWRELLTECQRINTPGGITRIIEAETVSQSSSQAITQLAQIFTQALHKAGHYFSPESNGFTSHLADLLRQANFQQVQVRSYQLQCHAGTVEGERFAENVKHLFRTGLPFFQKWTSVPANYEEIYEQALSDMEQPNFMATWPLHLAWGSRG